MVRSTIGVEAFGRKLAEGLDTGACIGVTGAVAIAPWLFGGAPPWVYLSLCIAVGGACCCCLLALCIRRQLRVAPSVVVWMMLLAGVVQLQMVPLPERVVAFLHPASADVHEARNRFASIDAAAEHEGAYQAVAEPAVTPSIFKRVGVYTYWWPTLPRTS